MFCFSRVLSYIEWPDESTARALPLFCFEDERKRRHKGRHVTCLLSLVSLELNNGLCAKIPDELRIKITSTTASAGRSLLFLVVVLANTRRHKGRHVTCLLSLVSLELNNGLCAKIPDELRIKITSTTASAGRSLLFLVVVLANTVRALSGLLEVKPVLSKC
jgi:hypothetical protein